MEREEKEYDRARSFERQNVPKASLLSPSFLTILHGEEERKHLKERGRERKGEGAGDLWSGSELPLSVKLQHVQQLSFFSVAITNYSIRLSAACPFFCVGGGCVCVCGLIRLGEREQSRWEGTLPGWETAVFKPHNETNKQTNSCNLM